MGASKSEQFSTSQNDIARIAKAMGHPARIAILEFILQSNSCICGDIVNELPLAQPTISQHLKELKNAGLIKGNIEGNAICYCINESGFKKIEDFFTKITTVLEDKQNESHSSCC
ncbi:ArsR/SmtB family transcription factor [Flavobacterium sp. TSSA_36]|uniref:ArsR/SmtB family transcription factor n=1 Tax=Flavobacterium sp. TSSA_36 TaxID=3447669 RepID=UPI003F3B64A2